MWKFLGAYGLYVAGLHLIDGPWREWKQGRSGSTVDPWTATHVAWGVVAQRMGISREQFVALGALNELVEFGVRTYRPDMLWGSPESGANVVVDMVANLAGWELGKRSKGA